jgi:methanogenic corrinoid protein MtbC1
VEEFLSVASLARRLGVAPSTLRTWARRYGLEPTAHEAGERRRYSPEDVAKLTLMRRLISSGVPPVEAASRALIFKGEIDLIALVKEMGIHENLVDALYRAAFALDSVMVEDRIRSAIADIGIERAWQEDIVPLLQKVGENWADSGLGVEVEHLLTEIIKRILRPTQVKNPVNSRPVLLAAIGDELHSLAIKALAASLAQRDIQSYFLGARTPLDALIAMVKRSAPPAIFLWAQMAQNADVKFFRDIPIIRPAPRIILGGPGWAGLDIGTVIYAKDLHQACEEIAQAIGV